MNKTEAKRIAHLIACAEIRNFIDAGGPAQRWPEADAIKVDTALRELATYHEAFSGNAVIPNGAPLSTNSTEKA